jgi:hypothetical protein
MNSERPLAVVLTGDATPMVVWNLRETLEWADVVLLEGTVSFNGADRDPKRKTWQEILGVESPQLRVVTTDLIGENNRQREVIQRNAALPVLHFQDKDRYVVLMDADELVSGDRVMSVMGQIKSPSVRLGLVPLYGSVDRVARSIHCCWRDSHSDLRGLGAHVESDFVFPGPVVATVGEAISKSPSGLRFNSPLYKYESTFGHHVTMADDPQTVIRKLDNTHQWDERIKSVQHMTTMLDAGVHHAGWWISSYREPEPWLVELAGASELRVAGDPLPDSHLFRLRAWAQARLDPNLTDEAVRVADQMMGALEPDQESKYDLLHDSQLLSPVMEMGQIRNSAESDRVSGDKAVTEQESIIH